MDWIDEARGIIRREGYRKVLFHLPAGLMRYWTELSTLVEEPVFSAEPCFGACDVPLYTFRKLGVDAIISFGHSKPLFLNYPGNVHFVEVELDFEPGFIPPCDRVGIVYVVQYRRAAERYARWLSDRGKTVVMGGKPGFMATYAGQVTGCDVEAARRIADEVDCFVVCADGRFHAQAVASLGKPTFNWLGEKVMPPKYPVARVFAAEKVGIFVSTKPGQFYMDLALRVRQLLEDRGKKVLLAVGDFIGGEIENFGVDVWVSAACPRLAEDFGGVPAQVLLKYLLTK